MTVLKFVYPLADNRSSSERAEIIADQVGLSEDHPVFESIGRPFHEVMLSCTMDTTTGTITNRGSEVELMLTSGGFNSTVETVLTRMGVNLAKDGFLSQVLMGFTKAGETVSFVAGPKDQNPGTEFGPKGEPVYVIPGSFSENVDLVERIFVRHGVVAAITIGEMWAVAGDAAVTHEAGTRVADNPNRVEVATVIAYAPSFNYFRMVTIPMVRGSVAAGSAFIKTSPTFIGTARDTEGGPDQTGSLTLNWAESTNRRVDLRNPEDIGRIDSWLLHVLH